MCSTTCMVTGFCLKAANHSDRLGVHNGGDSEVIHVLGSKFLIEYHNIEYLLLKLRRPSHFIGLAPHMEVINAMFGYKCAIQDLTGVASHVYGMISNRRQSIWKKDCINLDKWDASRLEHGIPIVSFGDNISDIKIIHPNPVELLGTKEWKSIFRKISNRKLMALREMIPRSKKDCVIKMKILMEIEERKEHAREREHKHRFGLKRANKDMAQLSI